MARTTGILLDLKIVALAAVAVASPVRAQGTSDHARPSSDSGATAALDAQLARVKAATESYRSLDSAVAAGYERDVPTCIEHQPHGAMGYHHVNGALLDDHLEPDRPEILVYSHTAGGEYKLNGVEYVVPYSARPRTAPPPTIMGQKLKRADGLQLWYLHVWLWEPNPKGVFADWNPAVRC